MEKSRICKICNRRFANGKAMGGHMRSHLAKLPLPAKPDNPTPPKPSSPSSSSSLNFACSENNRIQSFRSVNHELAAAAAADTARSSRPDLVAPPLLPPPYDMGESGESETESSPRNPTRRRSKRRLKSAEKVVVESPEQVSSSVSDHMLIFNEEDVAMCLLMLSKDQRRTENREVKEVRGKRVAEKHVEEVLEAEDEDEDEVDDDEDELFGVSRARSKVGCQKGKYRCDTCNKRFRSYQALGGHRASHNKMKALVNYDDEDYDCEEEEGSGSGGGGNINGSSGAGASGSTATVGIGARRVTSGERIFKCPFCEKAFESGQALGGHKKVHFSYNLGNPKATACATKNVSDRLLDLNLPAPPEDDSEVSQVELSATTSYAKFNFQK